MRSGTHPGQEHAAPSKAEYIAADLSLAQTNPCSRAADHTLSVLIVVVDDAISLEPSKWRRIMASNVAIQKKVADS